jgi:hypothetical protein
MQPKQTFQQILIIFYSIMVGHLLFASVVVFALKPLPNDHYDTNMLMSIATAISVVAVMLGYWMYQQQVLKIAKTEGAPQEKLVKWRTPFIVRLAMIESACLLNLVLLLVTGSSIFLYIYIGVAVAMLFAKPRHFKTAEELGLDQLWS